jgi:hypothetical protein
MRALGSLPVLSPNFSRQVRGTTMASLQEDADIEVLGLISAQDEAALAAAKEAELLREEVEALIPSKRVRKDATYVNDKIADALVPTKSLSGHGRRYDRQRPSVLSRFGRRLVIEPGRFNDPFSDTIARQQRGKPAKPEMGPTRVAFGLTVRTRGRDTGDDDDGGGGHEDTATTTSARAKKRAPASTEPGSGSAASSTRSTRALQRGARARTALRTARTVHDYDDIQPFDHEAFLPGYLRASLAYQNRIPKQRVSRRTWRAVESNVPEEEGRSVRTLWGPMTK